MHHYLEMTTDPLSIALYNQYTHNKDISLDFIRWVCTSMVLITFIISMPKLILYHRAKTKIKNIAGGKKVYFLAVLPQMYALRLLCMIIQPPLSGFME